MAAAPKRTNPSQVKSPRKKVRHERMPSVISPIVRNLFPGLEIQEENKDNANNNSNGNSSIDENEDDNANAAPPTEAVS